MEIKGTYNLLAIAVLLFGLVAVSTAQEYVVASYYTQPYVPSACFGFKDDKGVALISLSDKLWDGGKDCGSRYFLNCRPGNGCVEHVGSTSGIVAVVVDNCGDCGGAAMLLSEQVFTSMAKLEAGSVLVTYQKSF